MVEWKSFGLGAVAGVVADRVLFGAKKTCNCVASGCKHAYHGTKRVISSAGPRISHPELYFPKFRRPR